MYYIRDNKESSGSQWWWFHKPALVATFHWDSPFLLHSNMVWLPFLNPLLLIPSYCLFEKLLS
uniref:Uncharacterized protein n=1 Tax=Rhizophora mucronata TaxID=61149 RepID=A0A2P2PKY6_RHIMU